VVVPLSAPSLDACTALGPGLCETSGCWQQRTGQRIPALEGSGEMKCCTRLLVADKAMEQARASTTRLSNEMVQLRWITVPRILMAATQTFQVCHSFGPRSGQACVNLGWSLSFEWPSASNSRACRVNRCGQDHPPASCSLDMYQKKQVSRLCGWLRRPCAWC
jgi:hypothetical protein